MSILNFHKRTLEVVRELSDYHYDDFKYLLVNNKLTKRKLIEMFEENKLSIIRDVLVYESNLSDFFLNKTLSKDEILELRAEKIVKVNMITKNLDFDLFDFPLIINNQITIVESKYDWNNFKSILTFDLEPSRSVNTLIKLSLIDEVVVNEISLENFDLILSDLKAYNSSFSGEDIFKTITGDNNDFNEADKVDLKKKINEKLLEYLIVYDAIDFFEE